MEHTDQNILQAVSDTLTQKAIDITIDIKAENKLHVLLQRWNIKPKQRAFQLCALTMGNVIRISKLIVGLRPIDRMDVPQLIALISGNGDKLAEVLAIAIQNKKKYPPKRFIEFLQFNLSPKEMEKLIALSIELMGINHFLNTTFLIKGMSILETKTPEESQEKGPSVPGNESEML